MLDAMDFQRKSFWRMWRSVAVRSVSVSKDCPVLVVRIMPSSHAVQSEQYYKGRKNKPPSAEVDGLRDKGTDEEGT
jgi:hypothetical protein